MTIVRKDIENKKTLIEFFDYVLDFYGKGGIYDFGASRKDIITATVIYINKGLTDESENYAWGYGDSLDRERVRDILIDILGYQWKDTAILKLVLK
jgi:hypothetical protein